MINQPPPCKGLHIRTPIIVLMKGRGFINQGSDLAASLKPFVPCRGCNLETQGPD